VNTSKKVLNIAIGTAFAASLTAAPIAGAADNPFASKLIGSGYKVAAEAKCGGAMEKEMKAKEGTCGGMAKDTRSAEDIAANKEMMKEGKCGEGKCGVKNLKEGKCGGKK
jgi:uncharacterized low-complexity protein